MKTGVCVLIVISLLCPPVFAASAEGQDWVAQFVQAVRAYAYKPVPEAVLASCDIPKILACLDPASCIVEVKPSQLDFVRGLVQEGSLERPLLFRPGIAYIKIRFFGRRTASEFREALKRQSQRPPKGLIVDVRSNKGGFLGTARALIETWITAGQTYLTLEHRGPQISACVSSNPSPLALPTVVLVNSKTASCPELFAASLQDARKAKVVGTITYGKQFVQEAFPLEPGHILFLTTAKVVSRNTREDFSGVVPDIQVVDEEAQLKTALKLLRDQGNGPSFRVRGGKAR